jgi:SAM-dependent methyltransferase
MSWTGKYSGMSFFVAADAYDRFMGRYSEPLAPVFADFAGVVDGQRVLDVGCGPGALVAELVERLGSDAVSAADPSEPFVAAVRERYPEVTVHRAPAEELPFATGAFDAALAQLVVHFMTDPVVGLAEMARVARPDGLVAACVWDHAGDKGPLSLFWEAARDVSRQIDDESHLPGTREGHLAELFTAAGLRDVEDGMLTIGVAHTSFEDWWEPYTLGVGPAGAFVAGLEAAQVEQLRERCRRRLPEPPFVLSAGAWAARGRVSGD